MWQMHIQYIDGQKATSGRVSENRSHSLIKQMILPILSFLNIVVHHFIMEKGVVGRCICDYYLTYSYSPSLL